MKPDMVPLRIDIVSDVVCPWCIIGYKQVERALTLLEQPVEAEFHWHPFELNPDMPPEGEDAAKHIQRKYGRSAEQGKAVRSQIRDTAASLGFEFGEGGGQRVVNTFAAHKLLTKMGEVYGWQKQTALKLALFAAYFQTGLDVSDEAALLDIAAGIGLVPDEAQGWLADEALAGAVRGEQAYWRDENISGVPAIIFDGAFMVPGAQSAETFARLIEKILAKRSA